MPASLKSRTLKAALWNFSGNGVGMAVQFGIGVILARLLTPADFGLLGMILVFVALTNSFVEGGFGFALVHNKTATRLEETSVLLWNLGVAVAGYALLWVAAPYVATFYNQPILADLLRVVALRLLIGALGIVQQSVLARGLNFKKISMVNLAGTTTGGVVAIFLAWKGYGVWALVWQALVGTFCTTVLFWIVGRWIPVWGFSWVAIQKMGSYGYKMVASGLVTNFFENLNNILIGKFYTPADLGFYTRAQNLATMTSGALSNSLSGVLFPSLVQANSDPELFRRAFYRALEAMVAVLAPGLLFLALYADPVFRILFGERWLPAVPFFQVLAIAAFFYPVHIVNIQAILALGRPDLNLKLEILKRALGVLLTLAALKFGPLAIAVAVATTSILCFPINAWYPAKLAGLSIGKQCTCVLKASAWILIPTGLAVAHLATFPSTPWLSILFGSLLFGISLIAYLLIFPNCIYRYLFSFAFNR